MRTVDDQAAIKILEMHRLDMDVKWSPVGPLPESFWRVCAGVSKIEWALQCSDHCQISTQHATVKWKISQMPLTTIFPFKFTLKPLSAVITILGTKCFDSICDSVELMKVPTQLACRLESLRATVPTTLPLATQMVCKVISVPSRWLNVEALRP